MTTVRVEIIDPSIAQLGPSTRLEFRQPSLARAWALATLAVLSQTQLDLEGLVRAVRALGRAAAPGPGVPAPSSRVPAPPFSPR
jgi:hypothetical protein